MSRSPLSHLGLCLVAVVTLSCRTGAAPSPSVAAPAPAKRLSARRGFLLPPPPLLLVHMSYGLPHRPARRIYIPPILPLPADIAPARLLAARLGKPWRTHVARQAEWRRLVAQNAPAERHLAGLLAQIDRCRATSCPTESGLRQQITAAERARLAWAQRAGIVDAERPGLLAEVTARADRWLRARPREATAPVLLLVGDLHLQRSYSAAAADESAALLKRAAEHYARARALAAIGTDAGWLARYYLARVHLARRDDAAARGELVVLAAAPARAGTADVLFHLAHNDHDAGRHDEAIAHLSKATQLAQAGTDEHRSAWELLILVEQVRRRYDRALAAVLAAPLSVAGDHLWVAVDGVLRLGGLARASLPRTASPPSLAKSLHQIAAAALERRDLPEAARAWRTLLARAPDTLEAPLALAGMAALDARLGDRGGAARRRAQRRREHGAATAWATRLRASRGADGLPTDEQISTAAAAPEPTVPPAPVGEVALHQDATQRVGRLLRHCLSVDPPRHTSGALELVIEVTAASGAPARVRAAVATSPLHDSVILERWNRCFEVSGPAFFVGAPSLRAPVAVGE